MKLDITQDAFKIAGSFVISGRGDKTPWVRTEAWVLTVTIERDGIVGRGECTPYPRYNETLESSTDEIRAVEAQLKAGLDRQGLLAAMKAGAARNAVDCALWDWEAKAAGKRVWELAGLPEPKPVPTVFTLSLGEPDDMRAKAAENAHRPVLKVKLGGEGDIARLRAVREGAPQSRIVIDANEGWTLDTYREMAGVLPELGVDMVEQPLPAGDDGALLGIDRPLPVCADESCHDRTSLPKLTGKYDIVNIKLDKTGGLTEALALREAALAEGYDVMVGCMMGSSLAMAPAQLVAQGATVVDLDAPLLLATDREDPMFYDDAGVHAPSAALWG
ncbi:N-acetyl-D-Glu racemase DgcA [Psychromarinibacter halotolerans]|uniref:Dipeptide epimerase n=1 Tax=Psychromarinibacter halotolerans TaxID=1775175 RepID=A0ABV7GMC7_9RHOB|nr:N-acetyl-D-Glu racemase DgcA [Psychromarinibacter halotolerans]MAQ82374.1 dipeptide epimerase [Maritimibacter sp.]MAQ83829.1 dipeptide epimerase [Maritimibacter sp.]MDF0598951.1 dipeptide epimerase [Psychromarinibacter halotolerans]